MGLSRPLLRASGPQGAHHPHRNGLLLLAVPTCRRPSSGLFVRHDSILASKVWSLHRTQYGSVAKPAELRPPAWDRIPLKPALQSNEADEGRVLDVINVNIGVDVHKAIGVPYGVHVTGQHDTPKH